MSGFECDVVPFSSQNSNKKAKNAVFYLTETFKYDYLFDTY